jgi:hypothetical protein
MEQISKEMKRSIRRFQEQNHCKKRVQRIWFWGSVMENNK